MLRIDRPSTKVFPGTPISPSELLDLAEFATPMRAPSDAQLDLEAHNLGEWCDHNPQLAAHAAMLARGRGARSEVVDVLDELAGRMSPPPHRLAASA
jgi:hypothetical protein